MTLSTFFSYNCRHAGHLYFYQKSWGLIILLNFISMGCSSEIIKRLIQKKVFSLTQLHEHWYIYYLIIYSNSAKKFLTRNNKAFTSKRKVNGNYLSNRKRKQKAKIPCYKGTNKSTIWTERNVFRWELSHVFSKRFASAGEDEKQGQSRANFGYFKHPFLFRLWVIAPDYLFYQYYAVIYTSNDYSALIIDFHHVQFSVVNNKCPILFTIHLFTQISLPFPSFSPSGFGVHPFKPVCFPKKSINTLIYHLFCSILGREINLFAIVEIFPTSNEKRSWNILWETLF